MSSDAIEENRLRYRESSPGPILGQYVQCFAEFTVDPACEPFLHRIMPDGCCHMSYLRGPGNELGGLSIVGPRMTPLIVPMTGGQICWDVKLRPGAFEALVGVPVEEVIDQTLDARDVVPHVHQAIQSELAASQSAEDAWRVFAEAILSWLSRAQPVDPAVADAVKHIEESSGCIAVAELASAVSFSERQLQRRFQTAVGLSPKQFARIRRFRSCVGNMISESPDAWGTVAVRFGYSDQAHLTREFAELSGLPPTALEPYIRSIRHSDVTP
jgi:AraC-like DNA-binding protein